MFSDQRFRNYLVVCHQSYTSRQNYRWRRPPPPLQQDSCVDAVEAPGQQIDDILLIDLHNRENEDIPDDETDEGNEDDDDK